MNNYKVGDTFDEMNSPLEPIKVAAAYQAEIMKLEYRKKNKPQDINILDYTIMAALMRALPSKVTEKNGLVFCPTCGRRLPNTIQRKCCAGCGQRLYYSTNDERREKNERDTI